MKKNLLFVALLCLSTSAFSQKFQLGVKGGVNVSNYTGGDVKTKSLIGFHAGGLVNFLFGKNFSVQPELIFSSQGATYTNAGTKTNLKVSYINMPVMLKLKFNGGIYIEAGPQVGFKTTEDYDNPNQSVKKFASNLDFSVGIGLGYHNKSGIGIGARYMAGISKVGDIKSEGINVVNKSDLKNSVIQVGLFFTIFNNK